MAVLGLVEGCGGCAVKRLTVEDHELWEFAMVHAPVGMALLSPEGHYLRVNPALCAITGYPEEELVGLSFADITHPDDLAEGSRLHDAIVAGTSSGLLRKRYVRPDGSVVPVDLSMILQRNVDGTPRCFLTHVVDRSEAREAAERAGAAERRVLEEQLRTRAILDTDVVGLTLIDLEGRFHSVNATQQRFFDLAFPDGHAGEVGHPGHIYDESQRRRLDVCEIPSSRAARGEEFDNYLCWAGPDPATRRALVISARNVPDGDGRRTGSAMVFHDVTDMMRAVRAKNEFVASISHELRTPLTSALAHLELLEEAPDLTGGHRRHVEVALRNVLRLSRMVDDVLFASRAAAGRALYDLHEVDLVRLAQEATTAAAVSARAASVDILTDLDATLVGRVDGLRVRQVLDNLLSNAIAYSPHGEVTLALKRHGDTIVLSVKDNGEGVDVDELDHVFEWFFRGRGALERQVPGAGLGLTTVRTIVEAHGGTVSMSSTRGVGTCVEVLLPQ